MSTFEQVLELIETLTPEEVIKLRAHLDKLIAKNAIESPKQIQRPFENSSGGQVSPLQDIR